MSGAAFGLHQHAVVAFDGTVERRGLGAEEVAEAERLQVDECGDVDSGCAPPRLPD